jgi:hypothetical protein
MANSTSVLRGTPIRFVRDVNSVYGPIPEGTAGKFNTSRWDEVSVYVDFVAVGVQSVTVKWADIEVLN